MGALVGALFVQGKIKFAANNVNQGTGDENRLWYNSPPPRSRPINTSRAAYRPCESASQPFNALSQSPSDTCTISSVSSILGPNAMWCSGHHQFGAPHGPAEGGAF